MTTVQVESADDPRIADYRDVADPVLVRSRGLFVAEGRLILARVAADARYRVRSVLLSTAAAQALSPVLACLPAEVPVYVCDAKQFLPIAGFNVHRGCLAMVARPRPLDLADALTGARRIVLMEGVSNPDNVGGVFRNAAAFGVDAVVLDRASCDPLYRKAIRTSMGASLRVPFARASPWADALGVIRQAGFRVAALTPRDPAETLGAFVRRRAGERLALLIGAEGQGLSVASEAGADYRVRIPTTAEVDSLNVAVAAGIALSRLMDDRDAENR